MSLLTNDTHNGFSFINGQLLWRRMEREVAEVYSFYILALSHVGLSSKVLTQDTLLFILGFPASITVKNNLYSLTTVLSMEFLILHVLSLVSYFPVGRTPLNMIIIDLKYNFSMYQSR